MDWFRFYNDAESSKKVGRAARLLNISYPEALGYWALILITANKSPKRGWLMYTESTPLEIPDIAAVLRVDADTANHIIDTFIDCKLLKITRKSLHVIGWNLRQREYDSSTQRVRKHRKSRSNCNVSSPLQERSEAATETPDETPQIQKQIQRQNKEEKEEISPRKRVIRAVDGLMVGTMTANARDKIHEWTDAYGADVMLAIVDDLKKHDPPPPNPIWAIQDALVERFQKKPPAVVAGGFRDLGI